VHLSDAYERTVSGNESDPESGGLRILKISWEVVGNKSDHHFVLK
jgi:hypothetical protein